MVVKIGWVLHLPFDVDYLGHGPPRGRGGVELDCELNVSCAFVESGYIVNDGPSYPCQRDVQHCGRVWSVCTVVKPWSSCCQLCPAVRVCLPGWRRPCLEPAVPDVKTHWCTNDTWVKRVSSKKTKCGTWSSLFSLPVKELEFNKIGSAGREIGEVFKSGSTGI